MSACLSAQETTENSTQLPAPVHYIPVAPPGSVLSEEVLICTGRRKRGSVIIFIFFRSEAKNKQKRQWAIEGIPKRTCAIWSSPAHRVTVTSADGVHTRRMHLRTEPVEWVSPGDWAIKVPLGSIPEIGPESSYLGPSVRLGQKALTQVHQ